MRTQMQPGDVVTEASLALWWIPSPRQGNDLDGDGEFKMDAYGYQDSWCMPCPGIALESWQTAGGGIRDMQQK